MCNCSQCTGGGTDSGVIDPHRSFGRGSRRFQERNSSRQLRRVGPRIGMAAATTRRSRDSGTRLLCPATASRVATPHSFTRLAGSVLVSAVVDMKKGDFNARTLRPFDDAAQRQLDPHRGHALLWIREPSYSSQNASYARSPCLSPRIASWWATARPMSLKTSRFDSGETQLLEWSDRTTARSMRSFTQTPRCTQQSTAPS